MRRLLQRIGTAAWWVCLPGLMIALSGGPRTRVIIRSGGKILAVKGWLGNGKWSLPGGGLHRHEEPLAGAIREVREETGLSLDPARLTPLGVQEYRSYGIHFPCHYFVAALPAQTAPKPEFIEISEAAWLEPSALTVQKANADVLTAIRLVAAVAAVPKAGA